MTGDSGTQSTHAMRLYVTARCLVSSGSSHFDKWLSWASKRNSVEPGNQRQISCLYCVFPRHAPLEMMGANTYFFSLPQRNSSTSAAGIAVSRVTAELHATLRLDTNVRLLKDTDPNPRMRITSMRSVCRVRKEKCCPFPPLVQS